MLQKNRSCLFKFNKWLLKFFISYFSTACIAQAYLYNGECFINCPNQTYAPQNVFIAREYIHNAFSRTKRQSTRICISCDKTCFSCNGSNANECTSCYPGSQLRAVPDEGTSCHSFSERSSGNNYGIGTIKSDGQTLYERNGNFSATVFILVVIPGVFIVLGVAILVVYRNFFFGHSNTSFSYTPVAFDNDPRDDCEPFVEEENEESESETIK